MAPTIGVTETIEVRMHNLRAFALGMKEDLQHELEAMPSCPCPKCTLAERLLEREIAHFDGRIMVLTHLLETEEQEQAEWDEWDGLTIGEAF